MIILLQNTKPPHQEGGTIATFIALLVLPRDVAELKLDLGKRERKLPSKNGCVSTASLNCVNVSWSIFIKELGLDSLNISVGHWDVFVNEQSLGLVVIVFVLCAQIIRYYSSESSSSCSITLVKFRYRRPDFRILEWLFELGIKLSRNSVITCRFDHSAPECDALYERNTDMQIVGFQCL